MKKILLILSLIFVVLSAFPEQVNLDRAQKVGAAFLASHSQLKSVMIDDLIPVPIKLHKEERLGGLKSASIEDKQLVYLFKTSSAGYVLVAGDDRARAVLGYSDYAILDENNLPVNMLKWIEEYKKQIRFIRKDISLKSQPANSEWNILENGGKLSVVSPEAVSPLLTTTWNQSPYYNDLCPQEYWFSEKAVTGCVATAMAQVMKYHNYPAKGKGIHTYYHTNNTVTYGSLSANFGATTYNWSNMPNSLSSSSSATQVNAVATLMLHCGIAVDMDYSPDGSSAWVIEEYSREETCAEYALKEFFGYDKTSVHAVIRENYTTTSWIGVLKDEINASRPILFAGAGPGGGHAFVADGYDNNNYFHMNWGWGGIADGYYSVDAFNPVDLGTGAGGGSYNYDQRIVAGIKPPANASDYDLRLYSSISTPEIYQLSEFRIDVDVANFGTSSFTGELAAALFDIDGNFVEFIEIFDPGDALQRDYYWSIYFESEGLSVYPGFYHLGIYYKPSGGNWIAFSDGDYENFITVEIKSPFDDSDLKLYDSIKVTPSPVITGESIRIDTKIGNFSNSNYTGQLGAGLFYPNGDLAQELDVFDADLDAMSWYGIFYENEKITVEPGSYLVGLVHFPENSDQQIVVAPADYVNPVKVNVINSPLGPDSFEDNDDVSNAYGFIPEYENDYSGIYTNGTSIHSAADQDYFKISFPEGYNYAFWARVNDSYSSELDEEFTCDVIWAHSASGEWSDMYDDELDDPVIVYNGGVVYFGILPYFEGQTGSYSFSINILRELSTGVPTESSSSTVNVFPNPAKDVLYLANAEDFIMYQVLDNQGRLVGKGELNNSNKIDVSDLASGLYILKLHSENDVITKKVMINE